MLDWPGVPHLDHTGVALCARLLGYIATAILVHQPIAGSPFSILIPGDLPQVLGKFSFQSFKTERALLHSISLDRGATCLIPIFDDSWEISPILLKESTSHYPKLNCCSKGNTECFQDAYITVLSQGNSYYQLFQSDFLALHLVKKKRDGEKRILIFGGTQL